MQPRQRLFSIRLTGSKHSLVKLNRLPVEADSFFIDKFDIFARAHVRAHNAGIRARVMNSTIVTEAGGAVSDAYGAALDFRHGQRLTENVGVIVAALKDTLPR